MLVHKSGVRIVIQDHANAKQQIKLMVDVKDLAIEDIVQRIIKLNIGLREFWSRADGWAPIEAAQLLHKSRLDWQVSLSSTLEIWTLVHANSITDGKLILAWANLGSLIEGSMKLLLSVYYQKGQIVFNKTKKRNKKDEPDSLRLEDLRIIFRDNIWDEDFDQNVQIIQKRRNAIHAYQNRDIGTHQEFIDCVRVYLDMLRYINYRLPYPSEEYIPRED